jgi:hypothetical protein
MSKRSFLTTLAGLVGLSGYSKAAPPKTFPPVPKWKPTFAPALADVIDRVRYYTNQKRDFAVFQNGTCAILDKGLSDAEATSRALEILSAIFNFHPDMNPLSMDDGNICVTYNHPAWNIVIEKFAREHWVEIEANYLDGLTPDEVLITSAGPNKFDDFGKKALLGRCYMFMDAQAPNVVRIERATA